VRRPEGRGPRLAAAVSVLALALVAALGARAAECTLRVGWTPYAIYTFKAEDGRTRGIDADLIAALARDVGCEAQFREIPWARILLELENGSLDVTSSASRTPERERFALFSTSYRLAEMAIYVRRSDVQRFPLGSLADLPKSRMRLGYVVGYYYGPEFESLIKDPAFARHTDGAAGYEVNITKLLHDRIDGLLVDDVGVMLGWAKKLGVQEQVERHPLPIASDALHFMFSRAAVKPETVAAIDAALARMQADGRLQAIVAEYTN
jgi:polar amino acid transport system substrate-binding protein